MPSVAANVAHEIKSGLLTWINRACAYETFDPWAARERDFEDALAEEFAKLATVRRQVRPKLRGWGKHLGPVDLVLEFDPLTVESGL